MRKVILYGKPVPITAYCLWQRALCRTLRVPL